MRRSDTLKVLFVCVCVCTVCPAHPCGDNPLLVVDHFSRERGIRSEVFLVNLRETTPDTYNRLMNEYASYMDCTRAVQTGYYKRSVDATNTRNIEHSLDSFMTKQSPQRITDLFKQAIRKSAVAQGLSNEDTASNMFWKRLSRNSKSDLEPLTASDVTVDTSPSIQINDIPEVIKRLLRRRLDQTNYNLESNIMNANDMYQDV